MLHPNEVRLVRYTPEGADTWTDELAAIADATADPTEAQMEAIRKQYDRQLTKLFVLNMGGNFAAVPGGIVPTILNLPPRKGQA